MALRRGFSSICSVFPSLTSLAAVFPALKAGYIQQFSSLASLQSVANVPASSKLASLVAGLRPITTAAAEHCGPGPRESLEQVRSRIFGTHIGNGLRSGRKVLRKKLMSAKLLEYYPTSISKQDPFMLDLKAERAKLKLDRLKRRGKAPPKKGAGKRSGKK